MKQKSPIFCPHALEKVMLYTFVFDHYCAALFNLIHKYTEILNPQNINIQTNKLTLKGTAEGRVVCKPL